MTNSVHVLAYKPSTDKRPEGLSMKRVVAQGSLWVIGEFQLEAAWSNSRGEYRKICDYVYAQRNECILADANSRNLPENSRVSLR